MCEDMMTLEDFFTLTEMKDGLISISRVKELITVMQRENDCIVKNVGDATRQWSTVGSTIAATENRDCLDLFIQLNGLLFIDRWLKDAEKFSKDMSDSFLEESITALLRALEKLDIGNEKSVSSGIWNTVKNLLVHNSLMVQDRARALLYSWKHERDADAATQLIETVGETGDDDGTNASSELASERGHPECSPSARGSGNDDEKSIEPIRDEMNALQSKSVNDVQMRATNETLGHTIIKDGPPDSMVSSTILKPVNENLPINEGSPIYLSERATLTETCSTAVLKQHGVELQSDVPALTEYTDDAKCIQKIKNSPERLDLTEISLISSPLRHRDLSPTTDARNGLVSLTESNCEGSKDVKVEESYPKVSPSGDVRAILSEEKRRFDDDGSPNHRSSLVLQNVDLAGECCADVLQDSSGNDCNMCKSGAQETSFSRVDDVGTVDKIKEHASDESENDLTNDSDLLEQEIETRDPDLTGKRSDIELDYGIVDPLEVARQVAIEVEREVDCREPSCTSSEKISDSGPRQQDSPDSTDGKQRQPIEGLLREVPAGLDLSAESSPVGKELSNSEENLSYEPKKCTQDFQSSQVTVAAQEPETDAEKGICDFDLNQEVCSGDTDHPVNPLSTPVSVVSASRAAMVPGLPAAPLQFEGTLGWKGSAATSAFRPASPRKISEGDGDISMGEQNNSSKQRQDFLDIDLNVAEGGDNRTTDLVPRKLLPALACFPSGESSSEGVPRRSERLKLDLNRVTDEGDAPADLRMERCLLYHQNGHYSPSPSSSSSSLQPSLRNFDLNDQPLFLNDSSDHHYLGKSPQILNISGGFKSGESTISIMGAKVEVNRKDCVSQALSLPNGRITEPGMDVNLTRSALAMGSAVPYPYSAVYGYNGLLPGPNMSFSSALYGPGGPISYMVDSRGTPVVPQILGSASALPSAFSQPPFIMGMAGTPSSSNGPGPCQNNFDLNSGLMNEEGNGDSGGLRQFLSPGQDRSLDEHSRANSRTPSVSGVGGKRKEPDGGWEPCLFNNYKHARHPWK